MPLQHSFNYKQTTKGTKKNTAPSVSPHAIPPSNTIATKNLKHVVQPHVESFNFFLQQGLKYATKDIPAAVMQSNNNQQTKENPGTIVQINVDNVQIGYPTRTGPCTDARLYPSECRERGTWYAASMNVSFGIKVNNEPKRFLSKQFPNLPLMTRTSRCHLNNLSPKELVQKHEEAHEFGGTFICNGIERVIRMLQIPKRNQIMAIERSSFRKRGPNYSQKACVIRCVRPDQSAVSVSLHYLNDGGAMIRFSLQKQEFFIPVILVLKAFIDTTDREIYDRVVSGNSNDAFTAGRIETNLRESKKYGLFTRTQHLAYIGSRFRSVLQMPSCVSDVKVGEYLLRRYIFVHLSCSEHEAPFTFNNNKRRGSSSTHDSDSDESEKMDADSSDGEETKVTGNAENANSAENDAKKLKIGQRKFDLLILMLRKLYAFVTGDILEDNADSLMNQELLVPGHLYLMIVKEKLEEFINSLKASILRDFRINAAGTENEIRDLNYMKKLLNRQGDIGEKLKYFLATGNLVSTSGLDLMQASGYTVVAEKLNYYRYLAHFRSVHRGAFFTTMKTTTVRKLLPESWGFLCPVHTPDGGPCGLLQHLASACEVVTDDNRANVTKHEEKTNQLHNLLCSMGLNSFSGENGRPIPNSNALCVVLDGHVLGTVEQNNAEHFVNQLRALKVLQKRCVPETLEIAYFPPLAVESDVDENKRKRKKRGPYPGIYLATAAARMIRPVWHRSLDKQEILGPMEQVFLNIACTDDEIKENGNLNNFYTHVEIEPTNMLSAIASLTPFSDFNQSPRNMYQCQMGKQTMGTPAHSLPHRTDNKMYRIQTPQAPIVQNKANRLYGMDEYPNGTNAIVCVISYTGYDMEDAMILNKSSMERGFGHGTVYKTVTYELEPKNNQYFGNIDPRSLLRRRQKEAAEAAKEADTTSNGKSTKFKDSDDESSSSSSSSSSDDDEDDEEKETDMITDSVDSINSNNASDLEAVKLFYPSLDRDGLPPIGLQVREGDPICCIIDESTGKGRMQKHKSNEPAYIDEVKLISENKVRIKLRFNRNPIVGDKFSSRHGQKGVCSVLWPQRDMPFTESGMTPDIIINPHAFPSRMTIGMLVESMAGKAGACHGVYQDSTPFQFHEKQYAFEYFGEQLQKAGYNYYGSEPLYSGVDGKELHADIFIGCVYYQRLRHMVSDKSQVRATGPINVLTRQPIKGRKKHGGIRLGEMERDSLLAHGASFLLQDRLMNCSDIHTGYVCKTCGSMLGPTNVKNSLNGSEEDEEVICRSEFCTAKQKANSTFKSEIVRVSMPYVFRYLANELGAMNIKMTLKVK
jgi:DNA-directed RNA polymerase I subunit RPA2